MSGAGEEDKKPAEGGAHINLKVKGQVSSPAVFPSSSSSPRRGRLALLNPPPVAIDRRCVVVSRIARMPTIWDFGSRCLGSVR